MSRLVSLVALPMALSLPIGDPLGPLELWNGVAPPQTPCGLPPFTRHLPVAAREKLELIWKGYEEGAACEEQRKRTR